MEGGATKTPPSHPRGGRRGARRGGRRWFAAVAAASGRCPRAPWYVSTRLPDPQVARNAAGMVGSAASKGKRPRVSTVSARWMELALGRGQPAAKSAGRKKRHDPDLDSRQPLADGTTGASGWQGSASVPVFHLVRHRECALDEAVQKACAARQARPARRRPAPRGRASHAGPARRT